MSHQRQLVHQFAIEMVDMVVVPELLFLFELFEHADPLLGFEKLGPSLLHDDFHLFKLFFETTFQSNEKPVIGPTLDGVIDVDIAAKEDLAEVVLLVLTDGFEMMDLGFDSALIVKCFRKRESPTLALPFPKSSNAFKTELELLHGGFPSLWDRKNAGLFPSSMIFFGASQPSRLRRMIASLA
jgi:hypothetical protein